jgi:hypothetical protein
MTTSKATGSVRRRPGNEPGLSVMRGAICSVSSRKASRRAAPPSSSTDGGDPCYRVDRPTTRRVTPPN